MTLTEKETTALKDLHTQEKSCITKYQKYAAEAKDTELQSLFKTLQQDEQKHYQSIGQALNGNVPTCDCNDSQGKNYSPKGTYRDGANAADKEHDCFLATDCIGTEKLVSGEYNEHIFCCSSSPLRKLLADIQIEEQNHAEMLYKSKQVNAMA